MGEKVARRYVERINILKHATSAGEHTQSLPCGFIPSKETGGANIQSRSSIAADAGDVSGRCANDRPHRGGERALWRLSNFSPTFLSPLGSSLPKASRRLD